MNDIINMTWYPSREAALQRLEAFVPRAGRSYQSHRNEDHGAGAHRYVSGLSPYIRYGLLHEEEVLRALLQRHNALTVEPFVQQLSWHAYWQGWLARHPQIWRDYHAALAEQLTLLQQDIELAERYHRACSGETGIECFDSWAQELAQTGYLHNHARKWFASIWIFTLRLPWQLGADLFLRRLLDGDCAANTLSWRSVGGLHTRGKHFLARAEDIRRFTQGRFNPVGELQEHAEPLYEITMRPESQPLPDEPAPAGRMGMLVTEAHCDINGLVDELAPVALSLLDTTEARSPGEVSAQVVEFSRGALLQLTEMSPQPITVLPLMQLAQAFERWIGEHRLDSVLILGGSPGIHQELIQHALADWQQRGGILSYYRTAWQKVLWPHTIGGFFKFRQELPTLLSRFQ